jgi:hypothetical protein
VKDPGPWFRCYLCHPANAPREGGDWLDHWKAEHSDTRAKAVTRGTSTDLLTDARGGREAFLAERQRRRDRA